MPQRDLYIDRLRVLMTALVLLHHTAITYGAIGGWFWREVEPSGSISNLLLIVFCTTNQAYFMGFFFLLSGYFTPRSFERKGYGQFLGDRFLRLGIPLLAFGFLLGPLTVGLAALGDGRGFWPAIAWLWQHHEFINGPLWFAQALLIFSLAYCLFRKIAGSPLGESVRNPGPVPGFIAWFATALAVGALALAIRQWVPTGVNVAGLQLGYFSSYTFLFAIGIAAWRYDWIRQLRWKNVWPWTVLSLLALLALPVVFKLASTLNGPGKSDFNGGLTWPAIFYAFWEPLFAWGMIGSLILIFRACFNQPSRLWDWLGRRAYAVYIIHPPILVGVSILFHGWAAPGLVKFGVTGLCTCFICWLVSDPLVRLPGLRQII